jgi:hypothetical protein
VSKRRAKKPATTEPSKPVPGKSAPGKAPTSEAKAAGPAPIPEPSMSVRRLWLLAALLTFWSFGFTTMLGSDLWWHLASGRWIWQTGTLNFRDPWSFTFQGKPWMSHEWLSDLLYFAWWRVWSMESLVWWKWSVLTGAFTMLFLVLRRLSQSSLAAFLSALLAIAVGAPFFDVRPQLYSLLGFAVVLRLALLPSRVRWLLPLVFFVWVNLHGGFFFGLLALTTIFALARLTGETDRNALPLWLGCLVACLLNPGGPDAYVFPLHYALKSHSPYLRVGEWRPPWESGSIESWLYWPTLGVFGLSAVAAFLLRLHRKQPRLVLTTLALGVLTMAMSLKSRRFIPLFGISQSLLLVMVLAVGLRAFAHRVLRKWPRLATPVVSLWLAPILALAFGIWRLAPYPLSKDAFFYLTSQDNFPVEAMNVAAANHVSGKVFAFYEWGGYVDLRTNGRMKVFIDGRADTVFDDDTYRRYTRVLGLAKGWENIVDDSGADYVLWPRHHHKQIEGLLRSHNWHVLYMDREAALLIRDGLPRPSPLLPSGDSPWRELALGWTASGTKNYVEAEAHFQRALELMPNLRKACEWLANAYALQNRMNDAEATLDRCQRSFPDRARKQELMERFRSRAEESP